MATASSFPEQDCTCPVCCDIFNDPILLLCGHSFCKDCILEWWRKSASQKCPVCKEIFPMHQPPRNLALRNVSETVRERAASSDPRDFCTQHEEKFKLFCVTDQQLICLVCRDAKEHKKHHCVPLSEAAQDGRPKLKVALMRLKTERGKAEKVKVIFDKMAKYIKTQAQETEKQIKKDFQRLYQFLQARIDALRKEENRKSLIMNIKIVDLTAAISSLSDSIKTIEEDMEAKDTSFMLKLKANMSKAQQILPEVETPSTDLIDVAKHLGNLTFNVWKKMKGIVKYRPVILDPNTAECSQSVSKDLTSFDRAKKATDIPDNQDRSGIAGSEAFSSGRHSWNVEMDGGFWRLGLSYGTGSILSLSLYAGYLTIDYPTNYCRLTDDISKRYRVQLDYDQGTLAVYRLDTNTHLHTFKCTFTQPVYPFFYGEGKILPVDCKEVIKKLRG